MLILLSLLKVESGVRRAQLICNLDAGCVLHWRERRIPLQILGTDDRVHIPATLPLGIR